MPHIAFSFTYFSGTLGPAPPPPIPEPVGTMSFDDFKSYTPLISLNGLNSGSNEWNNTTTLAAYFVSASWKIILAQADFKPYTTGTTIIPSLGGSGSGLWDNTYDYYGAYTFRGTTGFDDLESYSVDSLLSGSEGGISQSVSVGWSGAWWTDTSWRAIRALDTLETYVVGDPLSGSNDQQDPRYQDFSGAWWTQTSVRGVKVYEDFSTYDTSSDVSGLNDQPDSRYQDFTGPWITRTGVFGIFSYDDFSTYATGSNVEGLNGTYSSSYATYTWAGPWIVRLNVSGSL